jgi:hypothetical protein
MMQCLHEIASAIREIFNAPRIAPVPKPNMLILRLIALGAAFLIALPASAGKTDVFTNQDYIEEAQNTPDFDIADMKAVLELVLGTLPDKVKVYPTENYYYFYFHYKGIRYGGNLRFDAADRDKGFVHFNYFKDFTNWQRDETGFSALYGEKDGVSLKAAGKLAYDLEFKGTRVRFKLNDLSSVRPPADAVQNGETYIGPVFDESGMRFFLVFDTKEKIFMYILDETQAIADQFNAAASADRITIGIRTGFAFYADRFAKRKILVGVNQLNTSINNYLDGPFDQLPDNFLEGETLRTAILAASPEMKGQIDRFGNSADGETRYLIAPYMQYEQESELGDISACAASEAPPVYYRCFSFADLGANDGEDNKGQPPDDGKEPPAADSKQ